MERLIDSQDNMFVISNPKSGAMELQQAPRPAARCAAPPLCPAACHAAPERAKSKRRGPPAARCAAPKRANTSA